jgi:hypothetical protein
MPDCLYVYTVFRVPSEILRKITKLKKLEIDFFVKITSKQSFYEPSSTAP